MNNTLLKLYVMFQDLMNREEGQDLVEYALIIALVSIALVVSLNGLTTAITGVFTTIAGKL
ncbi:MAG: Flp family type IVb pilin [Terracidiphilus sp.]|jgi:pilus assembly protein Flp/PilA